VAHILQGGTPRTAEFPTLADVADGECIRIREMVFERTRTICGGVGIRNGDTLACVGRTPHGITLQGQDGDKMAVDSFHARFIWVERVFVPERRRNIN
jgi:hypothetical protein